MDANLLRQGDVYGKVDTISGLGCNLMKGWRHEVRTMSWLKSQIVLGRPVSGKAKGQSQHGQKTSRTDAETDGPVQPYTIGPAFGDIRQVRRIRAGNTVIRKADDDGAGWGGNGIFLVVMVLEPVLDHAGQLIVADFECSVHYPEIELCLLAMLVELSDHGLILHKGRYGSRSYLKKVFRPNPGVGALSQIRDILQYACTTAFETSPCRDRNQNPFF